MRQWYRRWYGRPGWRGYYLGPLCSAVMGVLLWAAHPTPWMTALAAFAVGVMLYRFLVYPPWKHSEALRELRERQRRNAPDLRRPD